MEHEKPLAAVGAGRGTALRCAVACCLLHTATAFSSSSAPWRPSHASSPPTVVTAISMDGPSESGALESAPITAMPRRDPEGVARLLKESYQRSEEITKIFSKTFYFGANLLETRKRAAIMAIYVWCRRTDDIVDSPVAALQGPEKLAAELEQWERRLERVWKNEPTDLLDLALADTKLNYPELDISPFRDMIKVASCFSTILKRGRSAWICR